MPGVSPVKMPQHTAPASTTPFISTTPSAPASTTPPTIASTTPPAMTKMPAPNVPEQTLPTVVDQSATHVGMEEDQVLRQEGQEVEDQVQGGDDVQAVAYDVVQPFDVEMESLDPPSPPKLTEQEEEKDEKDESSEVGTSLADEEEEEDEEDFSEHEDESPPKDSASTVIVLSSGASLSIKEWEELKKTNPAEALQEKLGSKASSGSKPSASTISGGATTSATSICQHQQAIAELQSKIQKAEKKKSSLLRTLTPSEALEVKVDNEATLCLQHLEELDKCTASVEQLAKEGNFLNKRLSRAKILFDDLKSKLVL